MSLRYAWAFLTRLPGGAHPEDETGLGASVPWFPVVGAAIGAIVGVVYVLLSPEIGNIKAALIAIGVGVLITGAFHEDGLADTADAMGGYTPDKRLEIMKDSRVGTFGVLALIFSVSIRAFAVYPMTGRDAFVALVVAHTAARMMATVVMVTTPSARAGGLGAAYTAHIPRSAVFAVAGLVSIVVLGLGPAGTVALAAAGVGAFALRRLAQSQFGGITGDVLGAVEQVGEMAILVACNALVWRYGWSWS